MYTLSLRHTYNKFDEIITIKRGVINNVISSLYTTLPQVGGEDDKQREVSLEHCIHSAEILSINIPSIHGEKKASQSLSWFPFHSFHMASSLICSPAVHSHHISARIIE